MKAHVNYILLCGLVLIFTACKKEPLPEPSEEESPVFSFTGTVDGNAVTLEGGTTNYYLFATTDQDLNGLKSFTANFAQPMCTDCPNSLKIIFLDYALSTPAATDPDSSLYAGLYNYASTSGQASRYSVAFTKISLGPAISGISWDFGDGKTSPALNPVHTFTRPGSYNVCMNADFTGGCSSSLCNMIKLGNMENICEANIVTGISAGTSVDFSGSAFLGEAPYTYQWDFGDGQSSSQQNVTHNYAAEGVYQASLTITDNLGMTAMHHENVRTQNSNECAVRYSYVINPVSNPDNFGNVIVEWRDANGTVYTSKNDAQPQKSYFRINSIDEYEINENNQPTKKLAVSFSCMLYNGTDAIEIENGTAIIAVAY